MEKQDFPPKHPQDSEHISPKKKRKITAAKIQLAQAGHKEYQTIAEIFRMAKTARREPFRAASSSSVTTIRNRVEPDDAASLGDTETNEEAAIIRGTLKKFKLRCVIVDNRAGRESSVGREHRSSHRFVNIADGTGSISLCLGEDDAHSFGISAFDLPESERGDHAVCFSSAELSGSITWVQSKSDPPGVPTFYWNNGRVKKLSLLKWTDDNSLVFPTSSVLELMLSSRYSAGNRFVTCGICGRVDELFPSNNRSIQFSLEDPFGYTSVDIKIVKDHDDESELLVRQFLQENHIVEGRVLFIRGVLQVGYMLGEVNPQVSFGAWDCAIETVPNLAYSIFLTKLLAMNEAEFMGHGPESMELNE